MQAVNPAAPSDDKDPPPETCWAEQAVGDGRTERCVLPLHHGGRSHEDKDGRRWLARGSRGMWGR